MCAGPYHIRAIYVPRLTIYCVVGTARGEGCSGERPDSIETLTLSFFAPTDYAAFFCCAFNFAHRVRWNAAIFLRAAADIVCFTGAEAIGFAFATTGCDSLRALAHRARCACAILRRDAADSIRPGWFALLNVPEPSNDSITEIA
jgi:hypothetical protein